MPGYTGNVTGIAQDCDNRVTELAGAGVPEANIQVASKKYRMIPGGAGLIKQRIYVDGAGVNSLASPE